MPAGGAMIPPGLPGVPGQGKPGRPIGLVPPKLKVPMGTNTGAGYTSIMGQGSRRPGTSEEEEGSVPPAEGRLVALRKAPGEIPPPPAAPPKPPADPAPGHPLPASAPVTETL